MKIACQSCQAKYTIADEKVRGRVVKIRCKKCSTVIVVDGLAGVAASAEGAAPHADEHAASAEHPAAEIAPSTWTVSVDEADQRTLDVAGIVELYGSGVIDDATFVWHDGMEDWKPLVEVDELRVAVGARASLVPIDVADTGLPPAAPSPAAAFTAPTFVSPASAPARGEAAAVRRSPARAGATDLFAAATADHDDGVSTSASSDPQLVAPPAHEAEKPLGSRNENSVLFSLSSLTAPSPGLGGGLGASSSGAANADASGLIDMQMLAGSGAAPKPPSPSKKVDDIMSLGGGAFVPTLAAPVLAPPSLGASDDAPPAGARSSGGMSLGTVVGIVAVTLAAAASGVFLYLHSQPPVAPPAATATAVVPTTPTAAATALAAVPTATAPPAPTATVAPTPTVEAVKPAPAATVLVPGAAPAPVTPAAKVEPAKAAAPTPATPAAPPSPPTGVATPPAPAAAAPAEAPADGAQFDRAAAMTALGSAAGAAQSCRKPDGPTGSGRIAVTFAPSGAVTSAQVEGPPFAGTAVGGCVAARFRSARVPAFSGGTVTVHKSFSIN